MKTKRRIFILSELYFPEETSTGYFLTKIAESLAEEYEVKVITGPATCNFIYQNYPKQEVINKVEVFRCQGTVLDKNIFFQRLINMLTRSIAIFIKALFLCRHGDQLLVVTNPPIMPLITLFIKWIRKCDFILLIHDVYPEILVTAQVFHYSSLIVKIGQYINKNIYNSADKIITLGRDMTQLVATKLVANKSQIMCIPNWADLELITPTEKNKNLLLEKLGLIDKFVILYAGNMGRTHNLEDISEAAKKLKINSKIKFIISGSGAKKIWLEKFVRNQQLENVIILSPCERSELNTLLNACDVAIISFVPGMAGVSVPSRMYNQMAAGKPIIAVADNFSELALVVREESIGWVVEPGDIEKLVTTIQFASEHPELCLEMGVISAAVAKNKYSFKQVSLAYKNFFMENVNRKLE